MVLVVNAPPFYAAKNFAEYAPFYAAGNNARRKFLDLHELHKSPVATDALDRICALYVIEREIRGRLPHERCAVRQERTRPLFMP